MPSSRSTEMRSSSYGLDKKATRAAPSISSPRRKRPIVHSTAGEESASASVPKKSPSMRRTAKCGRISDRWPVLNRIMRANKSTTILLDSCTEDFELSSSSETEDEDGTIIIKTSNTRSRLGAMRYRRRVVHPASPKFPSPLSGVRPVKRLLVNRHNYLHRGYSQSALYHQRELWRKRKCEWDDYTNMLWQAGVTLEEAYGGIIEDIGGTSHMLPPHMKNGPWNRRANVVSQESSDRKPCSSTFINPSLFPRLGDLSATRDAFLISVDTWFADFPLWTLSKLVWIYDVNHRCNSALQPREPRKSSNTFVDEFDVGNSSADTLLTSYTDSSDTTLVNDTTVPSHPSRAPDANSIRTRTLRKNTFLSSSSFGSTDSASSQARTWETCWFSRWEILYNQISLAADIAASSGDPSPSANGSKEAVRVILTTPGVLYNPHRNDNKDESANTQDQNMVASESTKQCGTAQDDDDDDYGNVICISGSRNRFGAHVDPLSMFATADTNYLDPFIDSKICLYSTKPVVPYVPKDFEGEISTEMRQLTICC